MIFAWWIGCATPPTLPLVDRVPIVADNRCAEPREVRVVCVLDGDTFDIGQCGEGGERIRMLGIDAPEIAHPPDPAECWGEAAEQALRRRIEGQTVLLTFDARCEGVFGRTLAYVWDLDAQDRSVNTWMVEQGHARIYDEAFGDVVLQPQLIEARDVARSRGLGLWGECSSP